MKAIAAIGSIHNVRTTFIKVSMFQALMLISIVLDLCGIDSDAGEPPAVFSFGKTPLIAIGKPNQENIAGHGRGEPSSLQSISGQNLGRGFPRHVGRTLDLNHGKLNPNAANVSTIPHWSNSFTYNGLVYTYTIVGTDPKRGSATTIIPTVLIPLRFVFADGNVFDASTDIIGGQTPIQGITNSPIFQNYNFNNTNIKVGNTQWGDAFQRANFWDSVSIRAPNYHVLLGQPTVRPVQTINVPDGLFSYYTDPLTGNALPLVDDDFLVNTTVSIVTAANIPATTLPIVVWGIVGAPEFGGFHGAANFSGNALQTFIATGFYYPHPPIADVYVLSHEIVEWMDDPFNDNFTPGWDVPFVSSSDRCDSSFVADRLEVADPVEIFSESSVALPSETFTYHVTEAMFLDFFTRSTRSRSYNNQYSFFEIGAPYGLLTGPSLPCTGHVEFTPTYIDFPGATFTAVTGINKTGAVGFYNDSQGMQHGFFFNGSNYSTLDFPGALFTDPYKINDAGLIVGTFADPSFGVHGFSYQNGAWTQLDFPGSSDTEVFGVNAAGAIVGIYDGFQPVTHAFVLQNGQYQRIDAPFGTQANAFAINNLGSITGVGYTDPFNGPFTAFIDSRGSFSPHQFPGSVYTQLQSINNFNDLAGTFVDPDGTAWGMVTVRGYPYQVFAGVFGNDELNRICGYTFDDTGRPRGLIGTLPLHRTR